jgi:hypothetical protein
MDDWKTYSRWRVWRWQRHVFVDRLQFCAYWEIIDFLPSTAGRLVLFSITL